MTATNSATWTLAYRKPRANRFQRVTNWSGTWDQARELAGIFAEANPELQVYYTSTAEVEATWTDPALLEDRGNILTETGRRVRVFETGRLSDEILAQVPDAVEARSRFLARAY